MNRFPASLNTRVRRVPAACATLAALVDLALAGCGAGQISQSAEEASAVNGTGGVVGQLALRDVRIQAVQNGDFLPPGQTVDLVFVATNQSTDTDDELTAISTDVGAVSVTGGKKLPVGGALVVGTSADGDLAPLQVLKELRGVEHVDAAVATVALDKPISNGLTYDFTFDFKEAGPITLAVPISAGVTPRLTAAQSRG